MKHTQPQGYTLVEMVVSLAIFSIVVLLATSAYFNLIALSRQARATTTAMNSLAFVLDDMTRSIRTGSHFCNAGCTANSFSYLNQSGNPESYQQSGTAIYKQQKNISGVVQSIAITDATLSISALSFTVTGQSAADQLQPYVTIVIQGSISPGPGKPAQTFSVQTSISERGVDLSS